jgi:hypothetical protein
VDARVRRGKAASRGDDGSQRGGFFPIWLRYYSRFFAAEDIYVLDHESTDDSTAGGGFVRIPVTHDGVDHTWMVRTIESIQHDLIKRYDVVLITDVDEIVAPEPDWGSLGDYIDRFDEEFVNCLGYELLHVRDVEGPFRADRPVLEQRGHWFANDGYDKPLISTVPMEWTPGFHTRSDGRLVLDPDLRLIHLHRMDYDVCLLRHRWRRSRGWNQLDVSAGWAQHNRITEEKEFERWFYTDSCFEAQGITSCWSESPPPGAACSRRTPEVGASCRCVRCGRLVVAF